GRDLQVRGDAGQVRRRRGDRPLRRAGGDAERRGQGGAVRARHDACPLRVQPDARGRGTERDQHRHRHQHRHRRHGRHRQLTRAAVHGHRRRGEHCLAPLQRGAGGADHPLRRDLPKGAGRGGGSVPAAGAGEGEGGGAAGLQRGRPAQPRLQRRDDPPGLRRRTVRTLLRVLGLLLATGAAGASVLIVLPAPTKSLALAAIVASERSAFLVAAGVVALGIAFVLRGVESPFIAYATGLLSVIAVVFGLVPLVQARQLAASRGVPLDLKRYLHAQVDTEGPGHPDRTVPYLTVDGRALSLDVYLPLPRPATPSRALVVVHGGFWQAGQRGEASLQSRHWADLGYTVFDV